jgi:hypothetical protein
MNSPETNSFRNTPFQCDLDALMHAAQAFVNPHDVFKDEDRRSAKSGASLHLGRLKPARAKPPWCGTCPAAQPYHSSWCSTGCNRSFARADGIVSHCRLSQSRSVVAVGVAELRQPEGAFRLESRRRLPGHGGVEACPPCN